MADLISLSLITRLAAVSTKSIFPGRKFSIVADPEEFARRQDLDLMVLTFTMASAFAELERARIGERMETGRAQKRMRNGHLGGIAPYGFRVVGEKRGSKLEPVPEEQPILKEVLELASQKLSSWKITRILRDKGYKNRGAQPFECYQVKRIIERAHADHG